MKIAINTVVTLENGEKYLVVAATNIEQNRYFYLTEVDEAEENIKGNNKVLKELIQGEEVSLEEIKGEELTMATEKLEALFAGLK